MRRLALALTLAACQGAEPDLDPGLAPPATSVIAGDAVVVVPLADAHPIVLLLARVADATGAPIDPPAIANVTVIPAEQLDEGGDGVRTGRYAFGQVAPAVYVVQGLVDVDQNFNPLVPSMAMASEADLLGGYADVMTGALIPIPLGPGEVEGEATVLFARPPGS